METVGDRYVLVDLLDADARREIWRGHDDLASRPVVVRRYLARTADWRRDFDQRASALERLSGPGIASALRHDAEDDPPWLVTTWVDGETVAALTAQQGFTADDALAVIGQTAFALAAAHDGGVGHGRLDADHIVVRPDGSVALIGFAATGAPDPQGDLRSLAALTRLLLGTDRDSLSPDVTRFLADLDGARLLDPAEIGRTALALASAQRGVTGTVAAASGPADTSETAAPEPSRPWYDEDERKRVRNRLIALGAIVVIGGALLMRIFTSGAGQATVPQVTGLPYAQAQHQLNEVGFRASETVTTGTVGTVGTVIAQDPPAGTRLKVGGVVHLTVVAAERP